MSVYFPLERKHEGDDNYIFIIACHYNCSLEEDDKGAKVEDRSAELVRSIEDRRRWKC